ncbi:MAG: hypothetical protein H6586_07500 [Flavobacteriales bacterium]|nr:hypothetical protein [Flavobacteriales bacterium]
MKLLFTSIFLFCFFHSFSQNESIIYINQENIEYRQSYFSKLSNKEIIDYLKQYKLLSNIQINNDTIIKGQLIPLKIQDNKYDSIKGKIVIVLHDKSFTLTIKNITLVSSSYIETNLEDLLLNKKKTRLKKLKLMGRLIDSNFNDLIKFPSDNYYIDI